MANAYQNATRSRFYISPSQHLLPVISMNRLLKNLMISAMLIASNEASAYLFTTFSDTVYDANSTIMDATVGVTGFVIEDFEDTTLDTNLTVTSSNMAAGFTVFPNNSDQTWDGTSALTAQNTDGVSGQVNFNFATAVSSFGVGLVDVSAPLYISLNNFATIITIDLTADPHFDGFKRNMYLRIDAEASDSDISQITFGQTTAPNPGDNFSFDHLAMDYITSGGGGSGGGGNGSSEAPEPAPLALMLLGALALAMRSRKQSLA